MSIKKDPKKQITFTCNLIGCEKMNTQYVSIYDKSDYHFCGIDCAAIGKKKKHLIKAGITISNREHKRRIIKNQFDMYFKEIA